ncbi:TonB-dependent receptor [Sphingobacterium sp. E70]|uniref:TonB-dependent receptor n=1 Tax=Sphingobacterium sp. E70 TaxID=2853439 RepID=UPI00211C184A|nr:TonB-dependent receptor [Sphingobacterium sp. E70]ULT25830.1 TonB-dependent receptor [Sphingobacterium sp. E70]
MQVGDGLTHWSTLGYFARLNYNYADKYLIEANVRYDGTSKFARGRRWGHFLPYPRDGWFLKNCFGSLYRIIYHL